MSTREMIGRAGELRALTELIDTLPGQGGAMVVLGEAGIGKTSLVRAAVAHARAGDLLVLETSGVEAEAHMPFACLHQLLHPVISAMELLPVVQRHALRTAFGLVEGPPPDLFMIALAALGLLTDAAAERPVVLAVDDVQWLDRPTHEVLAFIARRVGPDPIVLIGTVREGHPGPILDAGLPELKLAGLGADAARQVLNRAASDLPPADRERILQEARGNPLALVELPVALRATNDPGQDPVPSRLPLTERLERAFGGRVADLPAVTRDTLLIAAVNSEDGLPEILAAAAVLAGRPIGVDVLDSAADAGLLTFDASRVAFRHPLVRSGILQVETVARAQQAHASLAAVLTDEPYRRALHRAQSIVGPDDEVADDLAASCAIALRRGSVTSAIWALERAAQLTTDSATRGRRLLLAAEHGFGLGRADIVDRLVEAASRNKLSDLDLARMEWLREIFNDGVPGDANRVLTLCDIARRAISAGDSDLALNLLLGAALRCWWADAGADAQATVVEVAGRLSDVRQDPRYVATLGVAEPVSQGGPVVTELSRIPVETVTDADGLRLLGMAAHAVGEPVRSVDYLDRAETKLREQGRLGLLSHVLIMQVLDRIELGDWDRAAAQAEEGRRLAQETGQPIWGTGILLLGAMVVALRGDNDRAQAIAADAERAAGGRRLSDLLACVQLVRGYGWLGAGQHESAYEALRPLFDPASTCFHATERFHGVMYLAEAAVHAGHQESCRATIAELEEVARVTPSATLAMHLRYARAVLAPDDARAEVLFHEALRSDLVRWPWTRARLELAYGSWLRRQRRVADSRRSLRSAQTTFDLVGAVAWADQARGELRAAGDRPATDGPVAATLLSAQELQIAQLAAAGLSNREIGERLFLSPRTVGSHLYRVFPKLNITSRAQLAARLGGSDEGFR